MHFISSTTHFFEKKVDGLTMYMTVFFALVFLVFCSLVAGGLSYIPQTIPQQLLSLGVVLGTALLVNAVIARLMQVSPNHISVAITALIVFFIVNPAREISDLHIIALVAAIAMASKYLIAYRKQHIVNPAAFGVMVLSLSGYYESTWWLATPILFLPLLLAGSIVVYKVRKWVPVLSFIGVGFIVFLLEEWQYTGSFDGWSVFWLSYPALFLAFFMLTEPFTMPPTKKLQAGYGALVGAIAHTTVFMPAIFMSPELALVIGNIIAYPFTLKQKLMLRLQAVKEIAKDTYEFIFDKPAGFRFVAGQYLEWMVPHEKVDKRGQRRYFTIASSPSESVVRLACKIPAPSSSYKQKLMSLVPGDVVIASQLAGDFTLPQDDNSKIAMIAGGIGVTPFRSQVQSMIDDSIIRDSVLFYCNNTKNDLAYSELWSTAADKGTFTMVPVYANEPVSDAYEVGFVTETMIVKYAANYKERTWYISGPPGMVATYSTLLRKLGVPRSHIIKDFFPGLA